MTPRYAYFGLTLLPLCLASCVSDNKSGPSVVIPLATTSVFVTERQLGSHRFEVRYRVDEAGRRLSRVVEGSGTYIGGGLEAYDHVLAEARTRMVKGAIETVNGIFVATKTEQMQKVWGNALNKAMYEDLKQETVSKLVGIAQIIGAPRCEREMSESGTTKIACTGMVKVPVVDVVKTEL